MCASFKPNLGVFKLDRHCELDIIPRKKTATMGPLNERTSDFFFVASEEILEVATSKGSREFEDHLQPLGNAR